MKAIPLWSADNKRVGSVEVVMKDNLPPSPIEHEGIYYERAYYGGWTYSELPAAVKV